MSELFGSYKKFRNKIADLGFEDSFAAAWAFSQYTQIKGFVFPSDVEKHSSFTATGYNQPYCWQLETIVREVVLNAGPRCRRGKSLKAWNDLAEVVNALRALEDEIHQQALNQNNVLLELLRIAHQQFPWQTSVNTRIVGRYFRIFNTPEIDAICQKLTGLSIVKIYALGSGLWGLLTSKPFIKLPMLSTVQNISDSDVESFFKVFSKDLYAFRHEIKKQHALGDTYPYSNGLIRTYPLIEFRQGGVNFMACPLPTLLFWRFTSGLYYDLVNHDEFSNNFGASFQHYIGDVLGRALKDTGLKFLPEEKYGPKGKVKDTVDWLIIDTDAVIFVECKTKRLTLGAKTNLLSRDALLKDVGILADAVVQVYKTIAEYQAEKYPSLKFDNALRVHPMIVTLENWYPLGNPIMAELSTAVRGRLAAAGFSPDLPQDMPYIIASAEEFEVAAQVIARVGCAKFFADKIEQKYEGWMLESYMSHAFKAETSKAVDLFEGTYDEILAPFK